MGHWGRLGIARLEAAVARLEGLVLGEGRVGQAEGLRQEGGEVVVRHLLRVRVRVKVRVRVRVRVRARVRVRVRVRARVRARVRVRG